MSSSISALIPELQGPAKALLDAAGAAGLQPRITSTRRSRAEQERLYRRFLSGVQPYPVAPPGTSAHEFGFAFDMIVTPLESINDVGATWESWGGVWGGEFNDPIHFEYPGFKAAPGAAPSAEATTWDYVNWATSFTSPISALLELLYIAASREEAEKILSAIHQLGSL